MPGIMDRIFGGRTEPVGTTAPTTQASSAGSDQQLLNNNMTIPNANTPQSDGKGALAFPAAGAGTNSPLDEFKSLWEPAKEGETRGVPSSVPDFTLSPDKLLETARSINMAGSISDERIQKAFGANVDVNAVKEMLNEVGQSAFIHTYGAGAKTIESAMRIQDGKLKTQVVPELHRRNAAVSQNDAEALFGDPTTAPVAEFVRNQMLDANPKASAQAINEGVVRYFDAMANSRATAQGKELRDVPKQSVKDSMDWAAWATQGSVN